MMRPKILWGSAILLVLPVPVSAATDPVGGIPSPSEGPKTEAKAPLRFGPVKPGLDVMIRGEAAGNFSLADSAFAPGKDDSRILFRVRPSVAYNPVDWFRARAEGQWYAAYDERDFSEFTLYQGFVEASPRGSKTVGLKAGRQELVYGSAFMLGADTFFDGLSFDAVKLSVKPSQAISVDAFGGQYVRKNSGGIEGKLYGVYATFAPGKAVSVDLYGLDDTGGEGATHAGGAHERTYSFGSRLCANIGGRVDVEVEPVWQFGRKARASSAHDDIRAFGGHVDVTIDPRVSRHPGKIFLSYAYGSGDGDPADGTFREFHNPNNDTSLVGNMSVVGELSGLEVGGFAASGLRVVTAGGGIDLTDKLNVSLDAHYFRANRVPAGFSRDVGLETDLLAAYKVAQSVSVFLSANRFFTGGFFRDAAGSRKDIGYYYLQVQAGL